MGKKYPGTYTTIIIEGSDVSDEQWVLTSNNQYTFNTTTINEDSTKVLTATTIGYIPVIVGDQVTSVSTLQTAKIIAVTLGKDEETTENYRMRYIESLFIDSQAGTTSYIKNHVMEHPEVGYAGVDYISSSASTYEVYVYVTGLDYLPVSSDVLTRLKDYYDKADAETNITPYGQKLAFRTFQERDIELVLSIKRVVIPLTEKIVLNYLETLSRNVYVPEIFNTDDLHITIDLEDLRNKFASEFTEYGIISKLQLKDSLETTIDLDKTLPKWDSVQINEER